MAAVSLRDALIESPKLGSLARLIGVPATAGEVPGVRKAHTFAAASGLLLIALTMSFGVTVKRPPARCARVTTMVVGAPGVTVTTTSSAFGSVDTGPIISFTASLPALPGAMTTAC